MLIVYERRVRERCRNEWINGVTETSYWWSRAASVKENASLRTPEASHCEKTFPLSSGSDRMLATFFGSNLYKHNGEKSYQQYNISGGLKGLGKKHLCNSIFQHIVWQCIEEKVRKKNGQKKTSTKHLASFSKFTTISLWNITLSET